jgi:hypothetical protein
VFNLKFSISSKSEKKDGESNDNKIRHLAEIDNNILAVFVVISREINEMYVADNSNIQRYHIYSLVSLLEPKQIDHNERLPNYARNKQKNTLLGKPKWIVSGYENLTTLNIQESDKSIFVLIKSNTELQHTVDKILDYYYDLDEIPKSLF